MSFKAPTFDIFCIACGLRGEWEPYFKNEARFAKWYGNFMHTRLTQKCPACLAKKAIVFAEVKLVSELENLDDEDDFDFGDHEDEEFGDEFSD